ncbi:SUMO protease [Thraustotheca clavata]|uniref:SUMO protease n=1 Tax=Thraustotheca clavata TaxID=74557 RepID=A0A1V9ZQN9_9STRA|nr:SUMO protease [Thraustotheca clavata]
MAAECAKIRQDAWRMQRRIDRAIERSENSTVPMYVATQKRVDGVGKLSRREYWKLLHRAIPSEYREEFTKKKIVVDARPSNDPFGVKQFKQRNLEMMRQLAITMKQLPQRKQNSKTKVPLKTVETKAESRLKDALNEEMDEYRHVRVDQDDLIEQVEQQLSQYRIERESGSIEQQHDMWVAERQWSLLADQVIAEELENMFDEVVEEIEEEGPDLALPEEDEAFVDHALSGGPGNEVLCQKFNIDITRNLLQCLHPGQWLNDEIINFYFQMLAERDAVIHRGLGIQKSHFFNSFFFSKVSEGGYNFINVRRWTRKIDLFAMDKIFIPVNIRNVHWCLAVIFMSEKRIQYFDSMNGAGTECLNILLRYLGDEHQHKKNEPFDPSEWVLVESQPDTPQQGNSHDCGMFTCMFADYLSQNKELTFRQPNMKFFRRRMVLRTAQGSIPEDEDFDQK